MTQKVKMGRPRGPGTHFNLTYNESLVHPKDLVAVFYRDGHVIFGHEDMIVQCRRCNHLKPQVEFSVESRPDKYGRKRLKSICGTCNTLDATVHFKLHKLHGPPAEHCQICNAPPKNNLKTQMDINHDTLEFRGWLCSDHNNGLGKFGDDPIEMLKAIKYLVDNDKNIDGRELGLKLRTFAEELINNELE